MNKKDVKGYKDIPNILRNMKATECIKRFGILYNKENPYQIKSSNIEKFYNDYNIQAYRKWYMPYSIKDIIIDKQLEKHPRLREKNIKNRIKILKSRLKKEYKNKTVNQVEKINEYIKSHIKRLQQELKHG